MPTIVYGLNEKVNAGGGSATGFAVIVLNVNTTENATPAGTSENDLTTYDIPANTLSKDGDSIRVTAWGKTAANANSKTLRAYFGVSNFISHGATSNNDGWYIQFMVTRTGVGAQDGNGEGSIDNVSMKPFHKEPAEDETGIITVKITGQDAVDSPGDLVQHGMIVEFLPAP